MLVAIVCKLILRVKDTNNYASTTNYNLVVAVLSMFFLLVKGTMYMLHVLPPVVSAVLHSILATIYAVAVAFQASSDTTDPHRLQNGPPWYITKSCSVTHDKSLVGYCQQAKATFACFVTMLAIFIIYMGLSIWSCFPSKAHQLEYAEKKKAEKARWAHLDEPENDYAIPETPGVQLGMNPVTPRTLAFNTLGGTRGLPFRAPEKEKENIQSTTKSFSLRSPGILRTPMTLGPKKHKPQPLRTTSEDASPENEHETQPYFPPPPKASTNK